MSLIKTDPREILSCGIFYNLVIGPTILSNIYLALMSIDRSIMILYPSRYRILITRRSVLIRVYLVLVLVIIAMIPHHFYFYYNKKIFTVRDRLYHLELLCGKRWNTYLILRYWFLILSVFTYSLPIVKSKRVNDALFHSNNQNKLSINKEN
ncbi:unnamed protein product [Adineta ricciae]|uniref:G-protein coupled receptors family 1 profile domain-containing protein n=1 Tax=Adineta ricciae TaxID=249248 RepID=A0A814HDA9_ADIRI|nr:unnamed protein product [Adineta ricciae]